MDVERKTNFTALNHICFCLSTFSSILFTVTIKTSNSNSVGGATIFDREGFPRMLSV